MGRPILILFSSFLVCLLTLSYFLYRPVNLFSDSFYAPKGFHRLTEGELRALAYLNGWKGKLLTIKIAAGAAAVPMAGHLVCASGLWCLNREIGEGEQFWVGIFIGLSVMVGLALCSYMAFTCYALRRRWDWIQTHQPLPEARILADRLIRASNARSEARRTAAGDRAAALTGYPERVARLSAGSARAGSKAVAVQILQRGSKRRSTLEDKEPTQP
jgi:hypothetical protein